MMPYLPSGVFHRSGGNMQRKAIRSIIVFFVISLALFSCREDTAQPELSKPAPTTILRHSKSLYTSLAFYAGMQLDIFTTLNLHPLTADAAAAAIGTKTQFAERLLCALTACDLLEVRDGVYTNTAEASRYLVRGKPTYMGEDVFVNTNLMQYVISGGLKTPESVRKGEAAERYDYSKVNYETWLQVFRGTMPVAIRAGQALAQKFDFGRFVTVADVGGASGGLAVALVKAYPQLKATVTDLPSITPVSKTLPHEQGAAGIEVEDWDVLAGPSRRSFDAAVLRALIQVLSPDQARLAMMNIGKSVNPGGAVYILGHIVDDSRTTPPEEVVWYLLNLNWEDQAGFYAERDYRLMLQDSGFKDIQRDILPNGDGVIFAVKPL
jgi:hypothetical protein